jgi:hypothetical protein
MLESGDPTGIDNQAIDQIGTTTLPKLLVGLEVSKSIHDFVERKYFGYLWWKGVRLYPIDDVPLDGVPASRRLVESASRKVPKIKRLT